VESCHCTVAVGFALAAAVKEAVAPAVTEEFDGFTVTVGAKFTVKVAAVVFVVPPEFVKAARY
jgi:hypothetical protein